MSKAIQMALEALEMSSAYVGFDGSDEELTQVENAIAALKAESTRGEPMELGILLAKFHKEVWDAATNEKDPIGYDIAGIDTAKEILFYAQKLIHHVNAIATINADGLTIHDESSWVAGTKLYAAPQQPAAPEWIPVAGSRIPETGLIDIMVDGNCRFTDCYYDHICDHWRCMKNGGNLIHLSRKSITHYMPLPSPPKVQS